MVNAGSEVSVPDAKSRSCICSLFLTLALICAVYFTGSALMAKDFRAFSGFTMNSTKQNGQCGKCKKKCRPLGSEALPEGIISKTSNLEMRPLWGDVEKKSPHSVNLLGIAVGIKQKEMVNKIVKKFLEHDFVVMLFHYDGVVDEWNDLEWSNRAIHVSAMNQTKWWFAKRFLHPDIVSEYDYIFLWDEDLGVENFHPEKYISIVREEGLEISQPGLDASKSEVHHHITVRRGRSKVHRRFYRLNRGGRTCDNNSTEPPCVGSQGDRTKKVGVVDAEYITHLAVPSLGGNSDVETASSSSLDQSLIIDPLFAILIYFYYLGANGLSVWLVLLNLLSELQAAPVEKFDNRSLVRRQSYIEMKVFRERWRKAIKQDQCWVDPFQSQEKRKTGT
uniref:Uncharacterized protein n=1 Tax=Solanum tuberosum TaxID=4113 RepID=M1CBQ2_SOLTU